MTTIEKGARRKCPECGQRCAHVTDRLSVKPLVGPHGITSTNIDRFFDHRYTRFLVIEEKHEQEDQMAKGQRRNLYALAQLRIFTVWVVKGTPECMTIFRLNRLGFDAYGVPQCEIEKIASNVDFEGYQALVSKWFEMGKHEDWLRQYEQTYRELEGVSPW